MFKFKGISSGDMKIIVEEELKFIKKAALKYNATEIPGRDGNLYEENGYADVEIPLHLFIMDVSKLPEIYKWLSGEGILEYNGKMTTARFYVEHEPIRTSNIYTMNISLIRSPFWTKEDDFIVVENTIVNEGNVYSEPTIRLEKSTSDDVDITINDVRFVYHFESDSFVEIDFNNCNATMNGLNKNSKLELGFETVRLSPGNNTVHFNSGECILKVKGKDRYL